RVLDTLRELRLDDETLVVFTADHGEEFGERGWLGHTTTLREEVVRVPLIIRDPRAAPETVSQPVSLVSIAPTVLDLLGIDVAEGSFHGQSLAPLLLGGEPEAFEPILIHVDFDETKDKLTHKLAIVDEQYKLILDMRSDQVQLFDLLEDPLEMNDLSGSKPQVRKELLAGVEELERRARKREVDGHESRISERELESLRALGYVND
ncbi:MAG: sulfatase-like hydrolase/transferase, partial [Deltaproteobacteria bacterium]|nr:sulfatase-like hydrolase/transferase [Deltaproteobacteria bacterium]